MTLVIAHRGASAVAPENTMTAFRRALEMGVDGIELDCQLSQDGHLVVFHDPGLERTSGVSGRIKDMTLDELRRHEVGAWFDSRFRGEPIPTLAEVFDLAKGRCLLNVEIKTMPVQYPGIEGRLVNLVRETGFPLDDLIVSSFDHRCLERLQTLEPHLALGALFVHYPVSFDSFPGTYLHPHWTVVDGAFASRARAAGRRINVWTANDPEAWRRLVDLEVDGIVTDHPDKLLRWLAGRGDMSSTIRS